MRELARVCADWRVAVWDAIYEAARTAATQRPAGAGDAVERARARFAPRFDELCSRLLVHARDRRLLPEVRELLDRLKAHLRVLERWSSASVVDFVASRGSGVHENPLFVAGREIDGALEGLSMLCRALSGEPARGSDAHAGWLTEDQQAIWNALDGRALTAKQLRLELDAASEEAVRQRIQLMRRSGCAIGNRRGVGYFRPDAPPV